MWLDNHKECACGRVCFNEKGRQTVEKIILIANKTIVTCKKLTVDATNFIQKQKRSACIATYVTLW